MTKNGANSTPDIVLVGTGVGGLQITVEGQRTLDRVGKAYALHPTPVLRAHLKRLHVKTEDLGEELTGSPADAYAKVATTILQRVAVEHPVVVLTPGSPMFLNSISRLLVMRGRQDGLVIRVIPSVSPLDALISYLGLDVARHGLQAFTARQLVDTPRRLDPTVPLAVLEPAGIADRGNGDGYKALLRTLAATYRPDQPATLVTVAANGGAHASRPLRRFAEFIPAIRPESQLFIDAVRPRNTKQEA